MSLAQYEIVNPSDACTVESADPVVAGVAIMLLGRGAYGLTDEEGRSALPLFLFGGHEEWLAERGVSDLGEYIGANRAAIADVLDSAMYGSFADRESYNAGLELIDDPAKREEWRRRWENDRRSSLNRICQNAWSLAEQLRADGGAS